MEQCPADSALEETVQKDEEGSLQDEPSVNQDQSLKQDVEDLHVTKENSNVEEGFPQTEFRKFVKEVTSTVQDMQDIPVKVKGFPVMPKSLELINREWKNPAKRAFIYKRPNSSLRLSLENSGKTFQSGDQECFISGRNSKATSQECHRTSPAIETFQRRLQRLFLVPKPDGFSCSQVRKSSDATTPTEDLGKLVSQRRPGYRIQKMPQEKGGAHIYTPICSRIMGWAQQHLMAISAVYIRGADNLTRGNGPIGLCTQEFFYDLTKKFGRPNLDLIATKQNAKVSCFASLHRTSQPMVLDGLSIPWKFQLAYIFPPRILQNSLTDHARVLAILPYWPNWSWFLDLKALSLAYAVLPQGDLLLEKESGACLPGTQTSPLSWTSWKMVSILDEVYLRLKRSFCVLAKIKTKPSFLPKVLAKTFLNKPIVLPSFCPNPSSRLEQKWYCLNVRRALEVYLQKSKEYRISDRLFVNFQGQCDLLSHNDDDLLKEETVFQNEPQKTHKIPSDLNIEGKHISIQKDLAGLEALTTESNGDKKPCPLCAEQRFRPCHVNKLHKHLQNLHWKVSVDFEGYRMCICCLPCLQVNAAQSEEELPGKFGAHYHCIICSALVARRRSEMLSHIKRHVTKGETEVNASPAPTIRSQEILNESNTDVQVLPNFKTPHKSGTFFNPKMKSNRQLIFCALAVLAEEKKPLECLDAFGSTGIMGLQWARHLGKSVKVTINDISDHSVTMIRENCALNKIKVLTKREDDEEEIELTEEGEECIRPVEVTQLDCNVLMHLRSFDFIHLDPFGTAVNYLDAAFRNVRNMGIVSVTSTDTGSLYAKTLHVAKRHYGCNIIRTEYFKELAARIVLSSIARAAARCNKGIEVLLSVALEHFVLVVVRVMRGPTLADESIKKINMLIHCHWCEERIFQKEGNMVEENPYKQLPCDCHKSMPGRSAVMLGPMWSGSLFNTGFLRRMLFEAVEHGADDIQPLLKTLICEAECTTLKQFSIHPNPSSQEESGVFIKIADTGEVSTVPGKRKCQEPNKTANKRLKNEARIEHPPFYYSIHRHAIGGLNIPKLNKILQHLSEAGFLVSRTHFDPTGIRTNAPLAMLIMILGKNSTSSSISQASSHLEASEMAEGPDPEENASISDSTLNSVF
ncbi:tRNA (guanine(27)-N(2))-dimethyltransferase [Pelodytes ibericus]